MTENSVFQGKIRVSYGFCALMAILLWIDTGMGILAQAMIACVLHESGHILVGLGCGHYVKHINITAVGAEIYFWEEEKISYGRDMMITAAGPVASFLAAWVAAELDLFVLAGMCLGQGIFNLLPILPLDGGRFLYLLLMNWEDGIWADPVTDMISLVFLLLLLGAGLLLLWKFGNPTLGITACWLLAGKLKFKERKRKKHLQKRK